MGLISLEEVEQDKKSSSLLEKAGGRKEVTGFSRKHQAS